jgi:hypothetical protein
MILQHVPEACELEVLANADGRVVTFADEHLAHLYLEELQHHESGLDGFVCAVDDALWRSSAVFGLCAAEVARSDSAGSAPNLDDALAEPRTSPSADHSTGEDSFGEGARGGAGGSPGSDGVDVGAVELSGASLGEEMRANGACPTSPFWVPATPETVLALRTTVGYGAFMRENFLSAREAAAAADERALSADSSDDVRSAPAAAPEPPPAGAAPPPAPPAGAVPPLPPPAGAASPPAPPERGVDHAAAAAAGTGECASSAPSTAAAEAALRPIPGTEWAYPPREHIFRLIIAAPLNAMRRAFETTDMRAAIRRGRAADREAEEGGGGGGGGEGSAPDDGGAERGTDGEARDGTLTRERADAGPDAGSRAGAHQDSDAADSDAADSDATDSDDDVVVIDDWHFRCSRGAESSMLMVRCHLEPHDLAVAASLARVVALAAGTARGLTSAGGPSCGAEVDEDETLPILWSLRFDARHTMAVLGALEARLPGLTFFRVPQQTLALLPQAVDECRVPRSIRSDGAVVMGGIVPTHAAAFALRAPLRRRFGAWARRLLPGSSCAADRLDDGRPLRCKVVDLGNACWTDRHFSDDIQTRQYRCPEVILGAKYCTPADMWSVACLVFELATGDLLFDPQGGETYSRDDDHLAQALELLGRCPKSVATQGKHARQFFNRKGELRNIRKLRFWPLEQVLHEKYEFSEEEAKPMADFLCKCLAYNAKKRATAEECLEHPWLNGRTPPL